MSSIEHLILKRRTIHDFSEQPVDSSVVLRALELALWAPNHRLTFPWRFVIAGPKVRQQVAELSVELKASTKELSAEMRAAIFRSSLRPSHLVLILRPIVADEEKLREDYASVAAGLQNAALYLWEQGVGSKWSTGKVTSHEKTYQMFGVAPSQEEILGFFWIGYPEKIPGAAARPAIDKFVRVTE